MPRLMSPLRPRYMRKPPEEAPAEAQVPEAHLQEPPAEPEYPETLCVSEGTYRQIRDDSLVLLSQGIEHRLLRSEEGPFQIFIVPEFGESSERGEPAYTAEL